MTDFSKLKSLFPAQLNRHKLTEKDFLPEEIFSSVLIEDSFKFEIKYALRDGKIFILEETRTPSSECEGEYIVFPAEIIKRRNSILKNLKNLTYK